MILGRRKRISWLKMMNEGMQKRNKRKRKIEYENLERKLVKKSRRKKELKETEPMKSERAGKESRTENQKGIDRKVRKMKTGIRDNRAERGKV